MRNDELVERMRGKEEGIEVGEHSNPYRTYSDCFSGEQLVDWFIHHNIASTRLEAIQIGQSLVSNHYIAHVSHSLSFQDCQLYYHFIDKGCEPIEAEIEQSLRGKVCPERENKEVGGDAYNMVVIGGGAAGLSIAAGCAYVGAKVALIEAHQLGGDCLHTGCVPSKALLQSAKILRQIRACQDHGIYVEGEPQVRFQDVLLRMKKIRCQIADMDSVKRFEEDLKVDVFLGHAKFINKQQIQVGDVKLTFKRASICTGSYPKVPIVPGLDEIQYLTSDTLFGLDILPSHLLIVGAGSVALEMAQCFTLFGSKVMMMVRSKVLQKEEEEAQELMMNRLLEDGVRIVYDSPAKIIGNGSYEGEMVGKSGKSYSFSHLLFATGRLPIVDGLGLEEADVAYDAVDGIRVNDYLMTTNRNIYSSGDCASPYQYTHVAGHMARIVIRNSLFFGSLKFSDLIIPWCTYTDPEVAHVGAYQRELNDASIPYDVYRVDFKDIDRNVCQSTTLGYMSMLTEKGGDKILGCTIVGEAAGEMIASVTIAMTGGIGLDGLSTIIFSYPTQSDALRVCASQYAKTKLSWLVKTMLSNVLYVRRL